MGRHILLAVRQVPGLARLNEEIIACRACPRLVAWREEVATRKRRSFAGETYWGKPVPGFGDPQATILVVGLAPAAHGANRTGRMFTGDRSGDFLYSALHRAGLASYPASRARDDGLELYGVYVTAPVRCAPPSNKPSPAERDACLRFLWRELDLLARLRVVVALGRFAYQVMAGGLGVRARPAFAHGLEVRPAAPAGDRRQPYRDLTIICSYHVSQQNTFTGKLTDRMLDDVLEQAKQLSADASKTERS